LVFGKASSVKVALPVEDVGPDASVGGSFLGWANPDDLVGSKGLEIYSTMEKNAQISACLAVKKASVLSRGWEIMAAADSGSAGEEVAAFCRYVVKWMDGSLFRVLDDVCDALSYGYSIQALVWDVIRTGEFAGKMAPRFIRSKDPQDWTFEVDQYHKVTALVHTPSGEKHAPEGFIVYTYRGKYGNPYGESDLRHAYRNWWSVDFIERFWNLYLEKFGAPTVKGEYRRGLTAAAKSLFLQALSAVQSKSAVIFPDDMKVSLLETIRQGESGFRLACEYHNRQIAKAILNQTLITDDGGGVGSFALAKVHLDVLRMCLRGLKQDLEETVMLEQFLRPLTVANYGTEAPVPVFSLGPLEDREIEPLSRAARDIVESGILKSDSPWLRSFLGIVAGGPAGEGVGRQIGTLPTVQRARVDGDTNDGKVSVG
jgi:phage gp29-like protein